MLMAATFAPTISALEGSVTRPVMEALVDWARRIGEHRTTARTPVKASVLRWSINHHLDRRFKMSKKYAPGRCAGVYHHALAVGNFCGKSRPRARMYDLDGQGAQTSKLRCRAWHAAGVLRLRLCTRSIARRQPVRTHDVEISGRHHEGGRLLDCPNT